MAALIHTPIDKPVYVTKWALTRGILKFHDGEFVSGYDDGTVYFCKGSYFIVPKDWFQSWESAVARYRDLIEQKQVSLQKQLVKLEKMLKDAAKVEVVP